MRRTKIIVVLICAALLLIVSLQNMDPVKTQVLMATVEMPRVVLLLLATALGFVAGFLVSSLRHRGGKKAT